jgi:hypothetical protein
MILHYLALLLAFSFAVTKTEGRRAMRYRGGRVTVFESDAPSLEDDEEWDAPARAAISLRDILFPDVDPGPEETPSPTYARTKVVRNRLRAAAAPALAAALASAPPPTSLPAPHELPLAEVEVEVEAEGNASTGE